MIGKKEENEWRNGVYLCTANNSIEADLLEAKLLSENIPCEKRYQEASNYIEILMGHNSAFSIDLYVPKETLEDAKNVIVAIPLIECIKQGVNFKL